MSTGKVDIKRFYLIELSGTLGAGEKLLVLMSESSSSMLSLLSFSAHAQKEESSLASVDTNLSQNVWDDNLSPRKLRNPERRCCLDNHRQNNTYNQMAQQTTWMDCPLRQKQSLLDITNEVDQHIYRTDLSINQLYTNRPLPPHSQILYLLVLSHSPSLSVPSTTYCEILHLWTRLHC